MPTNSAPRLLAAVMNDIQGLGRGGYLSPALRGGAVDADGMPTGRRPGVESAGVPGQLGSITNGQGQTLFDIREQLKTAVMEALASADGASDKQARVHDAIQATLTANGFDPAALDAARVAPNLLQSAPAASQKGFEDLDYDAMFGDDEDEESADNFLQMLLGQFRPGTNVNVEI